MNFTNFARTCTALVAGSALFAAVTAGAQATPPGGTFNVTTTIGAACTVTDDGPGNLTPTYDQPSNTGTGAETVLNTFCNGNAPTVTFTDSIGSGTSEFEMYDGSNGDLLQYQISNSATCSGIAGDDPISEGVAQPLTPGPSGYDICAAATVTNNVNTGIPAGTYTDTVTYTITP